jgi:hypothetical protein
MDRTSGERLDADATKCFRLTLSLPSVYRPPIASPCGVSPGVWISRLLSLSTGSVRLFPRISGNGVLSRLSTKAVFL